MDSEDLQRQLHIGDVVFMYLKERNGYVYSELTGSKYNRVSVRTPVRPSPPPISTCLSVIGTEATDDEVNDPGFPNIAFATFKVICAYESKAHQRLVQYLYKRKRNEAADKKADFSATEKLETKQNPMTQDTETQRVLSYGDRIQLMHIGSKKYISLSPEHTSRTENNSLLVQLTNEMSDLCVFVIQSRYKFRNEGDPVYYGDQIKLESLNTPGQFLHCSALKFSSVAVTVQPNQYELNLSAMESSISLVPHYIPSNNTCHPNFLKGGCCIQLFHRENEFYVVAEGSFTRKIPVVEDVHCRQCRVDHKVHKKSSTSANTFWQIEKQSNPCSGETLSWSESCRIKHLPTRCYLSVEYEKKTSSWKVFLKEKKIGVVDPDTLFTFHAIIEEGDEIMAESYARIRHVVSGRFLHLLEEKYEPRKDDAMGLQDTSKLLKLSTTTDKEDFDAFTLKLVEESLLDKFNYAAGIIPFLCQHIVNLSSSEHIAEEEVGEMISVLQHLCTWLNEAINDRDVKNCRKMLRNLGVIEQLIQILEITDTKGLLVSSLHMQICRKAYEVIQQYLKGNSRKNENYAAKYLEFIQSQIGKGLNAENVLVEFIQDNISIVTKMADTQMDNMILQLCQTKDPLYLHFLSALCVCSGRAIRATQDKILTRFCNSEWKSLFLRTKVVKEASGTTVLCYTSESAVDVTKLVTGQNDFQFLEAQVLLFARLCKGNNEQAIAVLNRDDSSASSNGFVSLDEAIACASNNELDAILRSRYVELILNMFVNIGRNSPVLNHLCYSFIYEHLVENLYQKCSMNKTQALSGEINENFPLLKQWILNTITNYKMLKCQKEYIVHNHVFAQTIDVLYHLVVYGYYNSMSDCDDVLKPLLAILDNQRHLVEFKTKHTLSDKPENRAVFAVNEKILEVIGLFLNFNGYVSLQHLLYDYKQLESKIEMDRSLQVLDCLRPSSLKSQNRNEPPGSRLRKAVHERLLQTTSKKINFLQIRDILINMACYQSDRLVFLALNLLTQIHFSENTLLSQASEVQLLIANESIEVYNTATEQLRKLRHLFGIECTAEGQQEIAEILDTLIGFCNLPNDTEPHQQNQQLLYNFGVLYDILKYLRQKGTTNESLSWNKTGQIDDPNYIAQEKIIARCLRLLHALACKNEQIQKKLFYKLNELLQIKMSLPALADLISEIFIGTTEWCLKVKEEVLEKIFHLILDTDDYYTKAQLMETLQALAKIEGLDLPVKRNQALIVKNYCQYSEIICKDLTGKDKHKEQKRLYLLTKASRDDPELHLLLSFTDMMATCAEGENLFIDSVCQNIFSAEELLKIINLPELSIVRKTPFLRFLIWVYFDTDPERTAKQALSHGESMWAYLSHVADLLVNIHTVLQKTTSTQKQDSLKALRASLRRRSTSIVLPPTANPVTIGYNIPPGPSKDNELILSVIDYLTQGIIPLLHAFYTNYFDPVDLSSEQLTKELTVSAAIATRLINLSSSLLRNTAKKEQLYLFHETVFVMYRIDSIRSLLDINPELIVKFNQKVEKNRLYVSHNVHCYQETFSRQLYINRDFRGFIKRYEEAYVGENTAKQQISSPVDDLAYSDEGEELPLGPNFQELVNYFMCRSKDNPSLLTVKPEAELLLKQLELSICKNITQVDQQVQDMLTVKCLQLLRALVHNRIKLIDPEMKDRNPVAYRRKCEKYVQPVQNKIQQLGNAVKRISPLLSHENEEITKETLALLKALLFSGNRTVQKGFDYLRSTRKENLFIQFKRWLEFARNHYEECCVMRQVLKDRTHKEYSFNMSSESHLQVSVLLEEEEPDQSTNVFVKHNLSTLSKSDLDIHEDSQGIPLKDLHPRTWTKKMKPLKEEELEGADTVQFLQPDISFILGLDVIGLMCDGQWKWMQNYLREQPDNYKSTNVVSSVGVLLQTCTSSFGPESYKLIHKILQTLIKLSVGNPTSQLVILDKRALESINYILRLNTTITYCTHVMNLAAIKECPGCNLTIETVNVKASAVKLMEIMMEETSEKTAAVISEVEEAIDRATLFSTITYFHDIRSHPLMKAVQMDDDAQRGMFQAFHIHLILSEKCDTPLMMREIVPDDYQLRIMEYCSKQTDTVEIHYETDEGKPILAKAYFNHTNELRNNVTEKIKWNINRDSMEVKHRALLDLFKPLKKDINHQIKLNKNIVSRIMLLFPSLRHYLLVFLTLLLCFILLFIKPSPNPGGNVNIMLPNFNLTMPEDDWFQSVGRYVLGSIHILLGLCMVTEHFLNNLPHFRLPKSYYKITRLLQKAFHSLLKLCQSFGAANPAGKRKLLIRIPKFSILDVNIFGLRTLWLISFLILSLLGMIGFGYLYSICALHIIVHNDLLQRVLRAVTRNGLSLLLVALLGAIVMVIYSVFSFVFLREFFYVSSDSYLYCDTVGECFFTVLKYGLLDNIGITIPLVKENIEANITNVPFNFALRRLIFDLSFFVIVTVIGLNIVLGIIVDSFSSLREERNNIIEALTSKCFICDIEAHEFDSKHKGFLHHVTEEHNMWNYVYYSMYLDSIDTSNHNAIQKYVYELIKEGRTNFFPQKEALCFNQEEEDPTGQQLSLIEDQLRNLLQMYKEKEQSKQIKTRRRERMQREQKVLRQLSQINM